MNSFSTTKWIVGSELFKRFCLICCLLVLFVMGMVTSPVFADDEPSLDELLNIEPEQSEAIEEDERTGIDDHVTPEEGHPAVELDDDVRELLRGDEAADVFEQAVRQMDGVARRLGGDLDPGLVTQREQESILAKLDQVIEAARQQQSSSQNSSSGGGGDQQQQAREQDAGAQDLARPSAQSESGSAQAGQASSSQSAGEAGDDASPGSVIDTEQPDAPLEELRREWGQLPPRLRDEISEGLQERFSPTYRSLTEAYYRRLAEEE